MKVPLMVSMELLFIQVHVLPDRNMRAQLRCLKAYCEKFHDTQENNGFRILYICFPRVVCQLVCQGVLDGHQA